MLKNHLKCEVEFYLQPCLKWSKEPCKEERLLLEYSQKFFSKINQFSSKIFDDSVYLYILEVLKNLSDKYEIKFFDTNSYFKESLNVNDWVFVDSVHCNDLGYSMIKKYIENNEY